MAAVELGTGYVSLAISTKGLGSQVAREFAGVPAAADRTGREAGRRLGSGLRSSMSGVGQTIAGVFGGTLLANAATGLLNVGKSAVSLGLSTAAGMEQAKIGFETMLGSGQKADRFLKQLAAFAAKTPFEFPELQQAASSLISAGIEADKVIPIMTTLGDVTSGMGTGAEGVKRATIALQQMNAAGRITGEDLNQLRDAGIPVYDLLASATGKSKAEVVKLAQAGKLGKKELDLMMRALETGKGLERFNGLMKKQSQSLTGMVSTLKDTLGQGLAKAIEPALPAIKAALGGVTNFIGVALAQIPKVTTALKPMVVGIKGFFATLRTGMTEDDVATGFERVAFAFRGVAAGASQAAPVLQRIGQVVSQTVVPAFVEFSRGLRQNFQQALPLIRQVGALLVSTGPVIATIFGGIGSLLVSHVLPGITQVRSSLLTLAGVVLPILGAVVGAFVREWPKIKPIVVSTFKVVGDIVTDVMGAVQNCIQQVTAVIAFIWRHWGGQITTIVVSAFSTVIKVIAGALKIVGGIVQVVTGLMTGDWRKAGRGIKQIVGGLRDILVAIFTNMRKILTALLGNLIINLTQKWIGFLAYTRGRLKDGLARIRDFILGPIRSARDQLATVLGQIRNKFSGAVTAIGTAWDRLKEVAKRPIRFVIDTVLNNGLIGAFNKIAGFVGIGKMDRIALPFHAGGWTGPGPKYQPAGIVHADEFVINKASRRRIERDSPGLLDRLNSYAVGGLVGGSGRFTDLFASRLLAAQRIANRQFYIFQRGFRPATSYSGTSHQGDAVDLGPITTGIVRALRSVGIAAWDRTNKGNWAPHIHGVPLPGAGRAGGSAIWQAQDYLRGGDGLGGRDNGPRVGIIGKIGAFIKAGFSSFAAWFKGLIRDPLKKIGQITGSPFGKIVGAVPRMVVEGMVKKVTKFDSGGTLPPGLTLAYNGTRQPERVLTNRQFRRVQRNDSALGGGITINGGVHGLNEEQVAINLEKRARRQRALQPSYA